MTTSYDVIIHKVESFAMSDFKEGDQVTICYGHRTNAQLLVHNGFVIDFNQYEEGIPLSLGKNIRCDYLTVIIKKTASFTAVSKNFNDG